MIKGERTVKKLIVCALICLMAVNLAACAATASEISGNASTTVPATDSGAAEATEATEATEGKPAFVTITTLNGSRERMELEVPYNPERLAVMELATLDIIDNFGLGDRVVGVSKGSSIDYLQKYVTDDSIANLGTIKEADLEAVMSCEPDLIFIGGRLSAQYDALSEIAPVVFLGTDAEIGLIESTRNNVSAIASIFGVADAADEKMSGYDARISALAAKAAGKTAVVGMCTSGGFNIMGNDGRCSIIGVEIGFDNLASEEVTSTHGNESSFETLVSLDPDYIFILDRDSAINAEGAQLAQEIMDNELVHKTGAYKNDQIVYLPSPAVWYTAEGGITSLDIMLSDLESAVR
jgi:iron complex transport system substrate-binding protein